MTKQIRQKAGQMKTLLRLRRFSYSLVLLFVLAINANAIAAPVTAKVMYYNSHRPSQARQFGQWDTVTNDSPVRSIHAALLHTGKVLLIAGSGNDQESFDNNSFRSVLWDPKSGAFTDIPTPWDAFCAGHTFLPNGNPLVAGGTKGYEDLEAMPKVEYQGLKDSYEFNPVTERYEKVDSMDYARWYPTLVGLGDGSVLSSSGLDEHGEIIYGHTEKYDPATKNWELQQSNNREFPTYPALFLTHDGRLFFSGSNSGYGSATKNRTPGLWNLTDNSFQEVSGLEDPEYLETSASVLLPPAQDQKVMVIGGGGIGDSEAVTNRTAIVDLLQAKPKYVSGPDLENPTRYPGAVILPDDNVLVTGGSTGYRTDDVFTSLIYKPKTNTFTKAASSTVGRNYHSEAILLPDGRVATFGSNPIDNTFEMRIEVFSPAYLFNGKRPVITKASKELYRGTQTTFKTSSSAPVASAKLMRPSAVTHVTDVEQRSINLPITPTKDGVTVQIPESNNLMPAGWYMAFVTDNNGIPSDAYWVHVN